MYQPNCNHRSPASLTRKMCTSGCEELSVSVPVKLHFSLLLSHGCTRQIAGERCGDREENSEGVWVAGGASSCGRHIHLPPVWQSADISVLACYKLRIKMAACEAETGVALIGHVLASGCFARILLGFSRPSCSVMAWMLSLLKSNLCLCLSVSVFSLLHCSSCTSGSQWSHIAQRTWQSAGDKALKLDLREMSHASQSSHSSNQRIPFILHFALYPSYMGVFSEKQGKKYCMQK